MHSNFSHEVRSPSVVSPPFTFPLLSRHLDSPTFVHMTEV